MRIWIINPNTTAAMTDEDRRSAPGPSPRPGTAIVGGHPPMGPASIESHYDEALSVPGLLPEIARGEREGVDGYVIACFGDPGLDAARELARGAGGRHRRGRDARRELSSAAASASSRRWTAPGPGLGPGRALRHAAVLPRTCTPATSRCSSSSSRDPSARERIADDCRACARRRRLDVIVLGCAGMADLCAQLVAPSSACRWSTASRPRRCSSSRWSRMRLVTSKHGEFATPPPKAYVGALREFALDGACARRRELQRARAQAAA